MIPGLGPSPRILIVRTSALGDIVHSLPTLMALRRQLPAARISWVIEEAFAPLLVGHPALDEVITVGLRPWRRRPLARETRSGLRAAGSQLRTPAPDVAVDLMGSHKGALLARLSGARHRLGAERRRRREPSSALWLNVTLPVAGHHAVDQALSLIRPLLPPPATGSLALEAPDVEGESMTPPWEIDFGGGLLREAPAAEIEAITGSAPIPRLLIQPGAGWGSKRYPPERWGEVAQQLAAATGWGAGVLAGPGEEALAERVVAASSGSARLLVSRGLLQLVAVLRRTTLVVGGDTGPLHLAHALGTPVLMVMGPTDPTRHGPYGAPQAALAHRLPCSFCYKRFSETKACLLEISSTEVAAAALSLLSPSG